MFTIARVAYDKRQMLSINFVAIIALTTTVCATVSDLAAPANVLLVLPDPLRHQQQQQQRQQSQQPSPVSTSAGLLHDARLMLVGAARAVRDGGGIVRLARASELPPLAFRPLADSFSTESYSAERVARRIVLFLREVPETDDDRWSREAVPASPASRFLLLSPEQPKGLRRVLRQRLVDAVLCPTYDCVRAVTRLRDQEAARERDVLSSAGRLPTTHTSVQVLYLGFTSIISGDVHGPSVGLAASSAKPPANITHDKPVEQVIHVAGRSPTRQTAEVLRAWLAHPEWPYLVIVTDTNHNTPFRNALLNGLLAQFGSSGAGNLLIKNVHVNDETLDGLLARSAVHLAPTGIEGFGHTLNEARALGAVLITTAHSPMTELVDAGCGVLIENSRLALWPPAHEEGLEYHFAQLSVEDIEVAVGKALSATPGERKAMGAKAQARYKAEHNAFFDTLAAVLLGDVATPHTSSDSTALSGASAPPLIVTRTDPPFLISLEDKQTSRFECEGGDAGNLRTSRVDTASGWGMLGENPSASRQMLALASLTGSGASREPGDAVLHSLRLLLSSPAAVIHQTVTATPERSVVVDVGTYLNGAVALYAAALGHRVAAADTRPPKVRMLREGIRVNGFEDLVTLFYTDEAPEQGLVHTRRMVNMSNGSATGTVEAVEDESEAFGRAVGEAAVATGALVVHIAGAEGLTPLLGFATALVKSGASPPCFILTRHDEWSPDTTAALHSLATLGYDLHFRHDFEQMPLEHRWDHDRHRPVLRRGATLAEAGRAVAGLREVACSTSAKGGEEQATVCPPLDLLLVHTALEACARGVASPGVIKAERVADGELQLPALSPAASVNPAKAWPRLGWLLQLEAAEHKVFSQNGEDGVLEALFAELGTTNRYYVEFGTWDGVEMNTRALRERASPPWHGLLMDAEYNGTGFGIKHEVVTLDNLVPLLHKYEVPSQPDLFSIDTDCYDFWLFETMLASPDFSPRVYVVEVNAGQHPPLSLSIPHPKEPAAANLASCQHTTWFGASVVAYHTVARAYGYSMVYCEAQGVNCFFVRDDVLGFRASDFLSPAMLHRPPTYGSNCGGHRDDPRHLPFREITQRFILERKRDGVASVPTNTRELVYPLSI
ncbi:hypothetical protein CYMTET_30928 [Cymbomonas tetramitiformis]|uniref:Glycosyl transferase family 1 domain-containing protein n=1 Tax=Cymbomonas tetramitiformis TaxID=36881 RepID=A0AAE0FII3_9CHLO|nr:hypothetical protein CYMTET_30928 [Cymbomonas tetramitiformis]